MLRSKRKVRGTELISRDFASKCADARHYGRSCGALPLAVAAVFVAITMAVLVVAPAKAEFGYLAEWGSNGEGASQFREPSGVAIDLSGNVYVAEYSNNRIQKFKANGTYLDQWGSFGTGDGQLHGPYQVATDSSGNVYVADIWNNRIQKFDTNGTYLDQWGSLGSGDLGLSAPAGVAVDSSGNVYVADTLTNHIKKFDTNGTYLDQWGSLGSGFGQFFELAFVAVDSSNNVYVADSGNNRIQKFDANGTYLDQWGSFGIGDGEFDVPAGIAVDSSNNVYVTDSGNNRVQKFDANGTYLDQWGSFGIGDGQFDSPLGIAVDSSNDVYVADRNNDRIQKFGERPISPPPPPPPPPPPNPSTSPSVVSQPKPLGGEAYEKACNLTITSPKGKIGKSGSAKVSASYARRLFTHGVKGYIDWGQMNGKDVVCKNPKMTILEKRGKLYYVPGTKIRVSKKLLNAKNFPTKGIRFLKKMKVGKQRHKSVASKRMTKLSFKDFNRKSRLGKRACNRLRKKGYRSKFVVFYTVEVDGTIVSKTKTIISKSKSVFH